jgi:hypothetical protein
MLGEGGHEFQIFNKREPSNFPIISNTEAVQELFSLNIHTLNSRPSI